MTIRPKSAAVDVDLTSLLDPDKNPVNVILDPQHWAGEIRSKNFYLELGFEEEQPFSWEPRPGPDKQQFVRQMLTFSVRDRFTREFSWAVPCREAVAFIQSCSNRILEVGAGTGFWAGILARAGIDIVATDGAEPFYASFQPRGAHYPVTVTTALDAIQMYPDRDLLTVWPSRGSWMREAAEALAPGRVLIFIGETNSETTADDGFFDLVSDKSRFEQDDLFPMVRFSGVRDWLFAVRKI